MLSLGKGSLRYLLRFLLCGFLVVLSLVLFKVYIPRNWKSSLQCINYPLVVLEVGEREREREREMEGERYTKSEYITGLNTQPMSTFVYQINVLECIILYVLLIQGMLGKDRQNATLTWPHKA